MSPQHEFLASHPLQDAWNRHGDESDETIFTFKIGQQFFVAIDPRNSRSPDHPDTLPEPQGTVVGHILAEDIRYDIYDARNERGPIATSSIDCLTCRELQIATLIADGKCDKEIARQLGISSYTVREHLRRIFAKLKVCKRTALVSRMLRGAVSN